ncbi:hypothetical protein EJ08DRAFT_658718 [Tothia fuscella]|uniref:Uncharacterized protein n=1 Tax=Tothia fuscella TaxID=1048955 RepID=A0A9P4NW13_9PEZI|nr:hypothetical protein EJ08DRAFT_658718 [Tothia fuscella]
MAEKGDAYIVNESDDDWTDVDDAEHEDPDYEANRMKYIPPSKKEKAFHIAREATIDVLEGGSIAKNRFFDGNYYGATSKAARTLGKGVWEVGKLVGMGVKEGALLAGEAVNNAGFLDRLPGSAKSVQARLDRAEEALMGRGQTERMYWQAKEARAGGVIDFQKEKSDEWQKEEEEWVNGDFTLDPDLVNIDRTEHHPDLQRVRDAKHAAKLAKYQARHEDSGSDSDYDIYSTTRNEYSVQREYVPGGKGVLNMVPCPYLPELTPEEEEEAKQCGFF